MPNKISCPKCNGEGYRTVLSSPHDDKTETVKCSECNGKGTINQMTDQEERDYFYDYW